MIHVIPLLGGTVMVACGIGIVAFPAGLARLELRMYERTYERGPWLIRAIMSATVNFQPPASAEPRFRLNVRASGFGMLLAGVLAIVLPFISKPY
jgi:hypothetical protein